MKRILNSLKVAALRLLFRGKGSELVKTVKYPLVSPVQGAVEELAEAIRHDNLHLFGQKEIVDLMEKDEGTQVYSVVDFWLDTLRLGMFFSPSANALKITLGKFNSDQVSPFRKVLEQSPFFLAGRLKVEPAERILSVEIRKIGKRENRVENYAADVETCFIGQLSSDEKQSIQKLANDIWDSKDHEEQRMLKADFFAIPLIKDPKAVTEEDPENETAGKQKPLELCVCLVPELYTRGFGSIADFLVQRLTLLRDKMSTDTAEDCLEYVGIEEEKGNGMNSLLGTFLKNLQGDGFEQIFQFMLGSYVGWQGKEDVLRERLDLLAEKVKRLPKPKFAGEWSGHRMFLHGQLKSWSSNFFRLFNETRELLESIKSDIQHATMLISYVEEKGGYHPQLLSQYRKLMEQLPALRTKVLDPEIEMTHMSEAVRSYIMIHKSVAGFLPDLLESLDRDKDREFLLSIFPRIPKIDKKTKEIVAWELPGEPEEGYLFTANNLFRNFLENPKHVPRFMAERIPEDWTRLRSAPVWFDGMVKQWQKVVNQLVESPGALYQFNESFLRQRLQAMLTVYKRDLQTEKFLKLLADVCRPLVDFFGLGGNDIIFKSCQDPRKQWQTVIPLSVPADVYTACEGLAIRLRETLGFEWKNLKGHEREDFLRLHQLLGNLLFWIRDAKLVVKLEDWMNNPCVQEYVEARKAIDLPLEIFGFEVPIFLNGYLFSELRQLELLLRRKSVMTSYSVKTTGSPNRLFQLVYLPLNPSDPEKKNSNNFQERLDTPTGLSRRFLDLTLDAFAGKLLTDPVTQELKTMAGFYDHLFGFKLPCKLAAMSNHPGSSSKMVVLAKPKKGVASNIGFEPIPDPAHPVFRVRSSWPELKYLEGLLYLPEDTPLTIELAETSVSCQSVSSVAFDLKNLTTILGRVGEFRVTADQPFKLTPIIPEKEESFIGKTYLGLDAGERSGVGFAIVTVDGDGYEVQRLGVHEDTQLMALQQVASKSLKEPVFQPLRKGTFRQQERIRKSLRGCYWNFYHALMIKYRAKVVHEESVGSSGLVGQWLRAFQKDLKKADVLPKKGGKNGVDKKKRESSAQDTLWGGAFSKKEEQQIAFEVQAAGSSQFCLKCGWWFQLGMREVNRVQESGVVLDWNRSIVTFLIESSGEKVYGFSPQQLEKGFRPDIETFKKMVRDFMRPPMFDRKGRPAAAYERFVLGRRHRRYRFDKVFEERFGRSALFICPRVGCGNFDHSSEQSAVVLALIGYIADKEGMSGKKLVYVRLAELMAEWKLKKLERSRVEEQSSAQ